MSSIEGADRIVTKLTKRRNGAKEVVGRVGYTAAYALYVHEDLQAFHPVGNAKFLSGPLRRLKNVLTGIVAKVMKGGGTFRQGVTLACLHLQAESQKEVPVDTGALKGSAFTRIEGG